MTTALEGGEGSASRPGRSLPPGKTRYPLYRRLGGPQGRAGQVRKISPPSGFDPRTVQPVASRYTDYATRPFLPAYLKTIFLNNKVPCVHSVTIIIKGEVPPAKSGLWYYLLWRYYKLFRIEARTKSHNDCLQILTCGSVDGSLYAFLVDHRVKGWARTLPLSPSLFLHLTWTPIFRVSTNGPAGNYSITFLTQPTGR